MSQRALLPYLMPAVGGVLVLFLFIVEAISGGVAVILLALLLAVIAAFVLSRPLSPISAAAAALARGDLTTRVRPRPNGEVGQLADAFNLMADNVQRSMVEASQEQSRLSAAMNSSIDAVMALDSDGKVLFANSAAEALFRRPASDIIDHPFAWVAPDDQLLNAFRASRDRGERQINLVEWPARQHMQVVTTPILGGGDWAVLAVFHDITDVRRTELIRRDFVANVSHELRTPLAAIKAVIETLSDGALEDSLVARDFLTRADSEVDRLIQLVEELLELSRIESGELPLAKQPTDLRLLLEDAIGRLRPQAERKHQTLSLDVPDELPHPAVDAARIERAVVNLLHNAIKFTPEEGSIAVSVEAQAPNVLIRFKDTGIGIASDDLPRVFERFYKVDHSRASLGSGLGLALVRHAIEVHGGRVSVESHLGVGTTFTVSLPIADANAF